MLIFYSSANKTVKTALNKCRSFFGRKNKKIISLSTVTAFLVGVVLVSANYRVGYTVTIDNTILGTVATKSEYYQILDEVKEEVNTISEIEFEPATSEQFSMEIVPVKSFTEKEELVENIKSTDENMVSAYAIHADGQFVAALPSEDAANTLLSEYLADFDEQNEEIEVSFGAEVTVGETLVPQDAVSDFDVAKEFMSKGKTVTYTTTEEDTIEAIAENFETTPETILNDNETEEITEGMTIKISTDEPVIPIKTVEHIDGNVEIPFETETVEDNTVYEGQTKITKEGVPGTKYLNAYVTKVNGVITMENTVETYVVEEPVAEVVSVGTKELPPSTGTGEFIMPTSGRLTSTYGRRWGRAHTGIDLAASVGTPIYASDNGIVLESEYQKNGYGNIIKVDHQNGFVTYYAHCSELYVKPGDVVAKGDLIAAVGNTGRSTGPHLHFEIRIDGNHKNPLDYIK